MTTASDFEQAVKGVSNSRAHIARTPCSCGGRFKPESQRVSVCGYLGVMADTIGTKCAQCGKEQEFVFPVGHFKPSDFGAAEGTVSRLETLKARCLDASRKATSTVKESGEYREYALAAQALVRKVVRCERLGEEELSGVEAKVSAVEGIIAAV